MTLCINYVYMYQVCVNQKLSNHQLKGAHENLVDVSSTTNPKT